ncbi:MAG: hypothetical protein M3Z96_01790 [Pseudomonadota bacterium]|nr:hypothetical protein [Pseudomonadota bacterium]
MRRELFALVATGLVLAIVLYAIWPALETSPSPRPMDESLLAGHGKAIDESRLERAERYGKQHEREPVPFISCQAGGIAAPSFFPWPPPQGSDEQDFTEAVVSAIHQKVKGPLQLKSVDGFLKDRLRGVSSFTYFSTPQREGYVAVTRLEQIDKAGHRLEGSARFSKDAAESGSFIYNFLNELVSLPEGRFRLFVFFVSSDPVATEHPTGKVTLQDADRWVGEGCYSLPPKLAELRLTDNHKVLLRVYEFVSKGSDSHLLSRAEAIPLAQHLNALGLGLKLDDRK